MSVHRRTGQEHFGHNTQHKQRLGAKAGVTAAQGGGRTSGVEFVCSPLPEMGLSLLWQQSTRDSWVSDTLSTTA